MEPWIRALCLETVHLNSKKRCSVWDPYHFRLKRPSYSVLDSRTQTVTCWVVLPCCAREPDRALNVRDLRSCLSLLPDHHRRLCVLQLSRPGSHPSRSHGTNPCSHPRLQPLPDSTSPTYPRILEARICPPEDHHTPARIGEGREKEQTVYI